MHGHRPCKLYTFVQEQNERKWGQIPHASLGRANACENIKDYFIWLEFDFHNITVYIIRRVAKVTNGSGD